MAGLFVIAVCWLCPGSSGNREIWLAILDIQTPENSESFDDIRPMRYRPDDITLQT